MPNDAMTRLSLTTDYQTVVLERPNSGHDIYELLAMFQALALGSGYHQSSWEDAVLAMAERYRDHATPDTDAE